MMIHQFFLDDNIDGNVDENVDDNADDNEDSGKKLTFLSPLTPSSTGWLISAT